MITTVLIAVLAGLVGFFANGVLAQIEDELPGGFENPDGSQSLSDESRRWIRIGRLLVGVPALLVASWGAWVLLAPAEGSDRALTVLAPVEN